MVKETPRTVDDGREGLGCPQSFPRLPLLPCPARHEDQLILRGEESCSGVIVSNGCGLCLFIY